MDIYEKYKKIEDLPVVTLVKKPESNKNLKGVMHILHGMCEHKGRYADMTDFFCDNGFICVISDMRGHGENVEYPTELGYFGDDGANVLVEDVHAVNVFIHNVFPDLPVIMVAHSMGTITARAFLKKYDRDVDFVFLSGAPGDSFFKYIAFLLTEMQALFFDDKEEARFIEYCMSYIFKRKYEKDGKNSYLCTDKDVVEKYSNDPKCDFTFTINGYNTLYRLFIKIYSKKGWKVKNGSIPVYFMAGSDDVYIKSEKRLKDEVFHLKKVGYENVWAHVFDGLRHEIFNETKRMDVWNYMLDKLKKHKLF